MNIHQEISRNNRQTFLVMFLFAIVTIILCLIASILIGDIEVFPIFSVGLMVILFFWTLFSYYFGDKMIASFVGAKKANRKEHFKLYVTVENLSIAAGLPNPEVYIIKDESLNAFATGRNPKHSLIAVTTGLIDKLNEHELEAVLAHEMGHIANYDIRLQLIVITVVGAISMLGEIMMRARGKKAGGVVIAGVFIYLLGVPILRLIRLALSRNREYLADATGAHFTRQPEHLASALQKISMDSRVESADRMNSAAHLFIASPKNEPRNDTKKQLRQESFISRIFATHPPIQERIKRLRPGL